MVRQMNRGRRSKKDRAMIGYRARRRPCPDRIRIRALVYRRRPVVEVDESTEVWIAAWRFNHPADLLQPFRKRSFS